MGVSIHAITKQEGQGGTRKKDFGHQNTNLAIFYMEYAVKSFWNVNKDGGLLQVFIRQRRMPTFA